MRLSTILSTAKGLSFMSVSSASLPLEPLPVFKRAGDLGPWDSGALTKSPPPPPKRLSRAR